MRVIFRFQLFSFALLAAIVLLFNQGFAQNNNNKVRISPKAAVIQTVGFTDVRIDYSRPGVKGREIWGGLVPYNKVWRAGANEATKITFSTDVKINGKTLKAGSYGFFAIPTKDKWTIIFNKVADQWGAFEYNEAEDALRLEVLPEKDDGCWQEWLAYAVTKTSDNAAVVRLEWEKLKIPFTIEVAIPKQ
ncbi:DUF2911 domain-containing protein [bacterium BMS3Abin03]|jgi:hypothetical protein|nr:DUF2911 domain-containing protein [bacterium BMS3Abin03]MCG6958528.1 DUF2911 domain-containing protein [bacterium BMS3Abin03]